MLMRSTGNKKVGGRPPKFSEARRPVTVTLPERILKNLHSVNRDRSRAIVKCVEAVTGEGNRPLKPVELVPVAPGKALILVSPNQSLTRIEWLRLVEITPARYLLALPTGTPVEALELAIHDLLGDLSPDDEEKGLVLDLLAVISRQRRGRAVSKAELVFVDVPGRG